MNINKAIQLALEHFQIGDLKQAEHICRKILKKHPNNVDALHFLGIICYQHGYYDFAIKSIKKALEIDPNFADAYNNLGNIFQEKKLLNEAISYYQKALKINPKLAKTYYNLGIALQDTEKIDEAIICYQKALKLNLHISGLYNNLGLGLYKKGKLDEAITSYQKALELNPDFSEAYNNLGNALKEKGQLDEAITCFQKALQLIPNHFDAYNNLGISLQEKGQLDEAITCFQKALQLIPNHSDVYNNLANIFKDQGKLTKAEEYYRRAIQIKPNCSNYYSNLLLLMNYSSDYNGQIIFSEHLQFAKQYAEPLSSISYHTNDRELGRRLRIGYISPDFRSHSVACFVEPVLATHNREHYEIFCYSDVLSQDAVTRRIQEHSNQWRSIVGILDEKVAELIQKDNIDILIDLAGHTAHNRILLFARKPAPVQLSWIGYPATAGLSTVDYKIVDSYTDPPGMTEQFYTETLIRLPESFLCYLHSKDSPEVGNLPAFITGYTTFGSFNNFSKVSPEIVDIWAKILGSIPNSHLIIKAKSLTDRSTRQYIIDIFDQKGISAERIELLSWIPSARGHLELYNRIDVGLDTFPYNGTTMTCEAMWMGVPVITLSGNTHASRVGVSLLSNVGLKDLIADTNEEYVEIAVNLANDLKRLQSLRELLRDMMKHSPLCDAKRFTANLEMCYRQIWEKWCESQM